MDIFIEIVTNPDGFAFTHSMVRAAGGGIPNSGYLECVLGQGNVMVASGCPLWGLSTESLSGKKSAAAVLRLRD